MTSTVLAGICTIGDEILIGQVVDTNSAMIARARGQGYGNGFCRGFPGKHFGGR